MVVLWIILFASMLRLLILLSLSSLVACTSTRTDDHSYHYNDRAPVQHVTYNNNNIVRQAPPRQESPRTVYVPQYVPVPQLPRRPSIVEQDEEYLQFHQETPRAINSSYRYSAALVQPGSMGPVCRPQPMYRLPEGIVPYSPMGTARGAY